MKADPETATNGREITLPPAANSCDVNCDVQDQSFSAKSNKFNGGAFSFRAGGLSSFAIVFSGLGFS